VDAAIAAAATLAVVYPHVNGVSVFGWLEAHRFSSRDTLG
jgi:hypothetical protein